MKNKKNIIIIVIIMMVLGIMIFNPSKYSSAFMKERIEHKELNRSTFAIYKELTQGGSDWTISTDTKFPEKGYILNTNKTECHGYNDEPIDGVLTQNDDMSITISSNKTIYCNVYFDKDDTAPEVSKFEIIGKDSQNQELRNGYTYQYGVTYEIGWLDTDVKEYCISSSNTGCNGEWTKTNGLTSITTGVMNLPENEGLKTMYLFIKDKANNISIITDISTKQITVDRTAPEVKALTLTGKDSNNGNLTNGFTYSTTIPWSATWDDSDVAGVCVANGATCTPSGEAVKSGNITLTNGDGLKNVVIQVKDNANNVSIAKTTSITVDRTIPVIKTFTIVGKSVSGVTLTNSNLYSHTINVGYTFNWTETNTGYYCITSSASCGTNDWVEINATSVSNAVKALASSDGNKTMNAFVKDKANNISAIASDSIMLDLTPPTVTIAKSSVTTESITVTLGGADGSGSGINNYQCRIASINNGTWENAILTGGTYQCTISGLNANTPYEVEGRTIDASGRISTTQTVSDTTEKKIYTRSDIIKDVFKNTNPSGLSTDLLGDMYRFVGTKGNVDNYICFGTTNKCNETSEYMYRIIGITTEGEMKLIKNTELNVKGYQWRSYFGRNHSWETSDLFDEVQNFCDNFSIDWAMKIVGHNWYIPTVDTDENNVTADRMFDYEVTWTERRNEAKGGLLYLHDYYYSYAKKGTDSSSTNCYSSSAGCVNSWLHISQNGARNNLTNEWTMTNCYHLLDTYGSSWVISEDGTEKYYAITQYYAARPVFYLQSSVNIISGYGTSSSPFMIELKSSRKRR